MLDFQDLDFTTEKFRELCSALAENYTSVTIEQYLTAGNDLPDRFVLMRHDVDGKAIPSLRTALIEKEFGIRATYYFRAKRNIYVTEVIQQIEAMGHEIGYHYETLSDSNGDYEKAIKLFGEEVQRFRSICTLKTISMHGASLSKYDNRDLWNRYDFKDFGIIGEAYLSLGEELNYFTDTGRGWNSKNNLRDFIPGRTQKFVAETTDDLIRLIGSGKMENLYITLHPDRWTSTTFRWALFWVQDLAFNSAKKALRMMRK